MQRNQPAPGSKRPAAGRSGALNEASTTLLRWLRDVGPAHGTSIPKRLRTKLRTLESDGAIAYDRDRGWWCTTRGEALIGGAA